MNGFDDLIIWIYVHTGDFNNLILALPVIILITMIYWFARLIWYKQKFGSEYRAMIRKVHLNEIIRLCTVCWFCALLSLVLTPTDFWMYGWLNILNGQNPFEGSFPEHFGEIVLTPALLPFISEGHLDWLWQSADAILPHLLLNILLFVPLGAALPFIYRQTTFIRTVLIGFSLSLLIEFLQFFLGRACETDDLICNTLGAVIGYLIYLLIGKILPGFTEKGRLSADRISCPDIKTNYSEPLKINNERKMRIVEYKT